jgi:hypothetical protein
MERMSNPGSRYRGSGRFRMPDYLVGDFAAPEHSRAREPYWVERNLLVERVFEFAIGMTNREDRAMRLLHHALGDASHQHVRDTGSPVRSHYDEIGVVALRRMNDFEER